jgi:hypothetical protein
VLVRVFMLPFGEFRFGLHASLSNVHARDELSAPRRAGGDAPIVVVPCTLERPALVQIARRPNAQRRSIGVVGGTPRARDRDNMAFPPIPHLAPDLSPILPHPVWHYSIRPVGHGEWSVERGQAEAGGTFNTCRAALRFMSSDLETVVLTNPPEIH